jgi:hypothetical protein
MVPFIDMPAAFNVNDASISNTSPADFTVAAPHSSREKLQI